MGELILVDKPYGWSSFTVVEWVKRHFRVRKAGHAGTLDPLATGLLLVATDEATREIPIYQGWSKEYYALVILGYRSLSDDAEYPPEKGADPRPLSLGERRDLLERFIGCILQRPPVFSAVKVKGQRAYMLARQGQLPLLFPRPVEIHDIEEVHYEAPYRWLLRIECGKGVYIRALARDIGEATGWGAYLGALRRTRIGTHLVSKALQPDGYLLQ
ncbi:MAG: tRNA pseudouridine(55) synthase TruB [Bacteroidia bacterium]|nr:tRNA pseudouridine(55) synthase TruB [Bacteroidia bacterium]MDW8014712.1 tRNA pseudouridine(55) synthase TruB [Bacteroidia bacterium]